ncbi:MAG: hypothetical protein VB066_05845 [Paludibacter sp.]|nr:hypothetical protein [Paludibacter sp.]
MKTRKLKLTLLALLASVIVIITLGSCSTKAQFLSSAVVPAARGSVQISKDFNKNYVIKINVYDLAGSDRLTPPRSTYVVWLVTADNRAKNIGQINTSNSLDASFETVSAFQPSKIMITAEDDANLLYPSYSEVILTTDYLR